MTTTTMAARRPFGRQAALALAAALRPIRQRGRERACQADLAALGDHLLRDIGIERDQIRGTVQRGAGPYTDRL